MNAVTFSPSQTTANRLGASKRRIGPVVRLALLAGCTAIFAANFARAQSSDPGTAQPRSIHSKLYKTTYHPWDLSALPSYQPEEETQGVIRFHGSQTATNLLTLFEERFRKAYRQHHHNIRFRNNFLSSPVTFSGLCAGTADVGQVGHKAWPMDIRAFREYFGYDPLEIIIASGTYDIGGSTPSPAFFVNKNNPISRLTLAQLDGIFGSQRTGGWRGGVDWDKSLARGPEKNIRTWGQLGLTGEWADKPIRLYGLDLTLSQWSLLVQEFVFQGGDKWNSALKEIPRGGAVNDAASADDTIVAEVAKDPYGIGFIIMRAVQKNPGVKALALARGPEGPYVLPTKETFQNQTYPLLNYLYVYLNRPPGKPLAPRLKEFLKFILSREGQECVAEDAQYLPLTAELAREQLAKLE
ncbi:MAG: substrate-binding domain-containing protein [Opitutaceae bacterium]|nr:substrate-binding domain-containing protein [Opitutaceae bacterium]